MGKSNKEGRGRILKKASMHNTGVLALEIKDKSKPLWYGAPSI